MREKIVDIALIVTLIVVAFGITWTLLTLNRSQSRPADRTAAVERTPANSTRISPLPLEREPTADRPATSRDMSGGSPASTEERALERPQRNAVDEPEAAEPAPVPQGTVRLERIGFSFVTGGAGACGIVLEPWRHVAVSRELLAAYGCGAEVEITLDDEKAGRTRFQGVVADTMNPSFSRTINIYVGEDEPALQYGVTAGTVRP